MCECVVLLVVTRFVAACNVRSTFTGIGLEIWNVLVGIVLDWIGLDGGFWFEDGGGFVTNPPSPDDKETAPCSFGIGFGFGWIWICGYVGGLEVFEMVCV